MDDAARSAGGAIDPKLLELLSCPLTKGPLRWDAGNGELVSTTGRIAYPVRDGIPIMLVAEARQLDEEEAGKPPPPKK